jgi:hypothetical protein
MHSRDEHEGAPAPGNGSRDGLTERLAELESTLINVLRPIDDDARLMDANLEDAHKLASEIGSIVKHRVFGSLGLVDPSAYRVNQEAFEAARVDEKDMYEVYADDLERHRKRQRKNLSVAESDSDKITLVKRRRVYIFTLQAFQVQASEILSCMRGIPSRPE